MSFKDFLSFDKMIAGRATQLLYWLGIVAILLYVFGMITGSVGTMSYNAGLGVLQFLVSVLETLPKNHNHIHCGSDIAGAEIKAMVNKMLLIRLIQTPLFYAQFPE